MEYLCFCNNCGTIMFDENPSIESKKKEIPKKGAKNMIQVKKEGEIFWACPVCKTDSFLKDL